MLNLSHSSVHELSFKTASSPFNRAGDGARLVRLTSNCGLNLISIDGKGNPSGGSEWKFGLQGEPSQVLALSLVTDALEADCPYPTPRQTLKPATHLIRMRMFTMLGLEAALLRIGQDWNLTDVHALDLTQGHAKEPFFDVRARFAADSESHAKTFELDMIAWARDHGQEFLLNDVDDNFGLGFDPGLPGKGPDRTGSSGPRRPLAPWPDPAPALPPLNAASTARLSTPADQI